MGRLLIYAQGVGFLRGYAKGHFILPLAKVSYLAVTTDLDEGKKFKGNLETVADDTSVDSIRDGSSLSSTIDSLVRRIVRHNEAAMTNLHAYLRQVNPSAAADLNRICRLFAHFRRDDLEIQLEGRRIECITAFLSPIFFIILPGRNCRLQKT